MRTADRYLKHQLQEHVIRLRGATSRSAQFRSAEHRACAQKKRSPLSTVRAALRYGLEWKGTHRGYGSPYHGRYDRDMSKQSRVSEGQK